MTKKISITSILILIFSFTIFWKFRYNISVSSYIPLLQLILIALILIFNQNFFLKKDFDSYLVIVFVFYILFNSIVFSIFNNDKAIFSLGSSIISLAIILPFFISRNLARTLDFQVVAWVIFIGASLFLLYYVVEYLFSERSSLPGMQGRTGKQRVPLIINFIFLLSLLMSSKSFLVNFYMKLVALSAFYYLIMSFSKGGYVLLLIDLILLIRFIGFWNLTLIIAFLFLLDFFNLIYTDLISRKIENIYNIFNDVSSVGSAYVRIEIWRDIYNYMNNSALRMFFGNGEAGVHIANLSVTHPDIDIKIKTTESQYISSFFRGGLVGLTLQVLILLRVTFLVFKLKFLDKENFKIYSALFPFFIGLLVFLIWQPSLRDREFGMFFYFLYGLIVLRRHTI